MTCDACEATYSVKYDKTECKLTSASDCLYTIDHCSTCNVANNMTCDACAATYTIKYDKSDCKLTSESNCL